MAKKNPKADGSVLIDIKLNEKSIAKLKDELNRMSNALTRSFKYSTTLQSLFKKMNANMTTLAKTNKTTTRQIQSQQAKVETAFKQTADVMGKSIDRIKKDSISLESTFEKTSNRMVSAHDKISKKAKKTEQDLSISAIKVKKRVDDLTKSNKNLTKATEDLIKAASKKPRTYGDFFKSNFFDQTNRSLDNIYTKLLKIYSLYQGVQLGKNMFGTTFKYEKALSNVTAISGMSESDKQLLDKTARGLAKKTIYEASDVMDAFYYMAKAGWKVKDSISAMPHMLNLSAADDADITRITDLVTDTYIAAGLSVEQIGSFADKLAYTATHSNTSVEQLLEGLMGSAGIATKLPGGIDEALALIGVMSSFGTKGAEAGVKARNIGVALAGGKDKSQSVFETFGIERIDKATGRIRSYIEIILELKEKLNGLTDVEMTAAQRGIFNMYDLSITNALGNVNLNDFFNFIEGIKNASDTANKLAEEKMKNTIGSFAKFKSSYQEFTLSLLSSFNEPISRFLDTMTDKFTKLGDQVKKIEWGTKFIDGFITILSYLTNIVQLILVIKAVKTGSSLGSAIGSIFGPVGTLVGGLIGGAAGGLIGYNSTKFLRENSIDPLIGELKKTYEDMSGESYLTPIQKYAKSFTPYPYANPYFSPVPVVPKAKYTPPPQASFNRGYYSGMNPGEGVTVNISDSFIGDTKTAAKVGSAVSSSFIGPTRGGF